MIRRVTLTVLFVLAISAGIWHAAQSIELDPSNRDTLAQLGPDYYMENFTVSVMDETGRLNYTLAAQHMDHFLDKDITQLTSPQIEFYQSIQTLWQLHAENGRIEGPGKEVFLGGEVHIGKRGTNQIDILTTNVTVNPETKTIQTVEAVQINDPAGSVSAVGLQANFKKDRMHLLSEVKTQYHPGSKPP